MLLKYTVVLEVAKPELLAAVQTRVPTSEIARAWKPALDQVWAFLNQNRELNPGRNFFLYHHAKLPNEAMYIDFGVQVSAPFEKQGSVQCVETPSGEVASTIHIGPYDRLKDAHNAVFSWCMEHNRKIGQASWEIYGHWNNDPALLETTIKYLLA